MTHNLATHPVHLGLGGTACAEPEFTGMDWYGAYVARHASDGVEGRLVSLHSFTQDWDSWEMHPEGEEVVICLDGEITLIQEDAQGVRQEVALSAGECAINPRGVWHTANVAASARVLFITAGWNTQGRARSGG
ncbi:cupin domain-containing protein [Novosphingobium sp. SG707]|uniref:cupin domain-containing protein n=1 Tax=Novosphingobium sp. SG707 TaxID=2586996 RepID=UPI0014470599|nr:cupin domain-containing protein [Novosphingobium sp. SG707]NKJ00311.1 mannose-6-phosphate isomerase-like protein (cupin superfamily) [Novosphingobium sp. SG707]